MSSISLDLPIELEKIGILHKEKNILENKILVNFWIPLQRHTQLYCGKDGCGCVWTSCGVCVCGCVWTSWGGCVWASWGGWVCGLAGVGGCG